MNRRTTYEHSIVLRVLRALPTTNTTHNSFSMYFDPKNDRNQIPALCHRVSLCLPHPLTFASFDFFRPITCLTSSCALPLTHYPIHSYTNACCATAASHRHMSTLRAYGSPGAMNATTTILIYWKSVAAQHPTPATHCRNCGAHMSFSFQLATERTRRIFFCFRSSIRCSIAFLCVSLFSVGSYCRRAHARHWQSKTTRMQLKFLLTIHTHEERMIVMCWCFYFRCFQLLIFGRQI